MKTVLLSLALVMAPSAAFAACGSASASFSQSCDQGVRIIRNAPQALPRISPTDAARLELQRDRLALDRMREANRAALAQRKADQEDERLYLQSYLYQDANSPLRQRFGFGAFTTTGPVIGRTGFVGGFRGGDIRQRRRH